MASPLSRSRSTSHATRGPASVSLDPAGGSDEEWVQQQIQSMASAWARGEVVAVEDLIGQRPGLATENVLRLIYEDICLRREAGQAVGTAEIARRFPRWQAEIEILLGCDQLLWPLTKPLRFPEVGETLGPFHLLAELGRGASGKTFLATEPALADRRVVLKVISDDQEEHLSLARVQHTHIIPLFSEQTFPELGLRALCMPYLGGTTLGRLLDAMEEVRPEDRSGRRILEALDRIQATAPSATATEEGPYRRYLEHASFVDAVCWISACLADALQEAHARGLVHMDVKPSNVLIAADGMPMLLDFHLAGRPIKAGEKHVDRVGGTPGWMAPEQGAALEAVTRGRPVPELVDHRADLYALGLLMRQALGGHSPGTFAVAVRAGCEYGVPVSTGLADIVGKCLAPHPSERYQDATTLADDLRRHLNHLPLRGAPNRSVRERWSKWRRREPWALARAVAWMTALTASAGLGMLGLAFYDEGVREAQRSLEDGRRMYAERRFGDATAVLAHGEERLARIPGTTQLRMAIQSELERAEIGRKAEELRHVADLIRFWYGTSLPAGESASELAERIFTIWEDRDRLLGRGAGEADDEIRQGIKTDLRELAIVWANLRVQRASGPGRPKAFRDALTVLNQVESVCGPSPALRRERHVCEQGTGQPAAAREAALVPQSPWEHDELGRSLLRSRMVREAVAEFQKALDARPQDFWPNFYQGLCQFELGEFAGAVSAFRTCIALNPTSAECYYNRARAYDSLGEQRQALEDYSRALAHNPGLVAASLSRGILHYKSGQHALAIADFERALQTAADHDTVGRVHYNLALAHLARGDQRAARASMVEAINHGHSRAAELRGKLRQMP